MKNLWLDVSLIAIGGALGANARYWLGYGLSARLGAAFPWGTFVVNVSGSFAAGLVSHVLERFLPQSGQQWRHLLITGFLGGYTTFSAYELESFGLLYRRHMLRFVAYFVGSVVLGLIAALLGYAAGGAFGSEPPRRDA